MKEVKEIVGYLYIKNGKIMGSDKTGKNIGFGKPFKITLPGYYRMIDGTPKLIISRSDLKSGDTFVGNRDWNGYYQKRMESTGKNTLEETYGDKREVEVITNPTAEKIKEAEEGFNDTFTAMTW